MATDAKSWAREIVQGRKDAYNKKVNAGTAIPDTFEFNIRHTGKTDHRINWSYGVETENGPRLMMGNQEFQTF